MVVFQPLFFRGYVKLRGCIYVKKNWTLQDFFPENGELEDRKCWFLSGKMSELLLMVVQSCYAVDIVSNWFAGLGPPSIVHLSIPRAQSSHLSSEHILFLFFFCILFRYFHPPPLWWEWIPTRFQLQPSQAQGLKKSLTKWDQREHRFLWLLKQFTFFSANNSPGSLAQSPDRFSAAKRPWSKGRFVWNGQFLTRGGQTWRYFGTVMSHSCISYDMYISITSIYNYLYVCIYIYVRYSTTLHWARSWKDPLQTNKFTSWHIEHGVVEYLQAQHINGWQM